MIKALLRGDFVLDENGIRVLSNEQRNEYTYNTYVHKSNADWHGYKAHIWEGGHMIPFIAKWPKNISAGTESNETVCLTELFATIAAITKYDLPDNAAEDSYNVLAVLLGEKNGNSPIREATIRHSSFASFR